MADFVNIIGFVGALVLVFAYFKLTFSGWTAKSWGYQYFLVADCGEGRTFHFGSDEA